MARDPLHGLGPLARIFVVATCVVLSAIVCLAIFAAFFAEFGPISDYLKFLIGLIAFILFAVLVKKIEGHLGEWGRLNSDRSTRIRERTRRAIARARKETEADQRLQSAGKTQHLFPLGFGKSGNGCGG